MDDWQRLVLAGGMGQNLVGGRWKWAASRVGCWVPRQNGKGGIIEARVLAGLFLLHEPLIIWSAHQYNTAQEGFLRIRALIEGTPDLHRQVRRYWTGTAWQGIELKTGERVRFLARSSTSGRGFTGRCNILDEAQELTAAQVAAIFPTVSAQPDSQIWMFGTPPTDPGAWCYGLRADGEAGKSRLAWFDWGGEDGLLHEPQRWSDRDLWYATNPTLGGRIPEETVEDECGPSGLGDEFVHERLGVWRPPLGDGSRVLPAELWQDLADAGADRPEPVAFALVVSRDRTRSAIGWAGRRPDGLLQVGLSEWRPGTGWVVDRLVDLRTKWNPLGVAVAGRSESLLMELERRGVTVAADADEPERGDLAVPSATDEAAAYGLFVDTAREQQLRHLDDAPVNTGLAQAGTRPVGGGMTWDDRHPGVAPLRAATLAAWLFESRAHLLDEDGFDPAGQIF